MKIYLFYPNKIYDYSIPKTVLGSFSFDVDPEETSKLINIEARNGKWYLYSTSDSLVIANDGFVSNVEIVPESYYVLKRDEIKYLIYITETFDNSFLAYSYDDKIDLIVGNNDECNLKFNFNLVTDKMFEIKMINSLLTLIVYTNAYINGFSFSAGNYSLRYGDEVNLYGLRIIIFSNFVFVNNPAKRATLYQGPANIILKSFNDIDKPKNIEIKDRDLYKKEDYFSKSPRLRRLITTEELEISPPPNNEKEQEMPLLLSIGTMLTMGVASSMMLVNNIIRLNSGEVTLKRALPQLITSVAMLLSTLLWPNITKLINSKIKKRRKAELIDKYQNYLNEKRKELTKIANLQREILVENLIPIEECVKNIINSKLYFWDKRIEQNDFLTVRIGHGNELLDIKITYPDEDFTFIDNELRDKADSLIEEFKYIKDVPIGYSFYNCKITAIMGNNYKSYGFMNNVILQLLSFYSYDDIKFVVFTNEKNMNNWEYLRYLNHSFSNDKSIRFFSSNPESAKNLGDYLNQEIQARMQSVASSTSENSNENMFKPYYVVIVDDYDSIRRHSFMKILTEVDYNLGFSLIILENHLSKLPSKCNNFISLGDNTSGVLKNSFEEQEQMVFYDEINHNVDMMNIAKIVSNIPIEFQEGGNELPESLTFLEMEKVGKVEQLNILNRWNTNDSTQSLKAEIGVNEEGNLLYLDLHEKAHGPHGLIAGMTGSGKSEFIITYILSMAINYSPDDVAFILIDYKGGGLAFAFENKTTGVVLPHLAGTITNLDKAEMNRTLVSIDSEVKRRQKVFNEARDLLGESTMDIYKYQRNFKDGRLKEAVPHLFIICDEFAELKSQQPEFMDDLISIARIGRSLGVHLILATQKPSGVVNDQIWSNTKFRVCLKVQSESDSREMLKRSEAASLKQAGRFYLQVGYDEYFVLGQSGWCGAKYFPSEKIIKQEDKSINFIGDIGNYIKSIQSSNNVNIAAQGEQLAAIMSNIIEVSKMTNKRATQLWLNSIDSVIKIDNLIKKYSVKQTPFDVNVIIGEFDAPENQEQGPLMYSLKNDGNTIICGNDEAEREMLISTILYSTLSLYNSLEFQFYMVDYGSESSNVFVNAPHCGGIVFTGDDERFKNLFKYINEEIKNRKKLLTLFGGSIEEYNKANDKKLNQILVILNNYEAILESYTNFSEELTSICRDCSRYGIYFIISCTSISSLGRRLSQNFINRYALHLSDSSAYYNVFDMKVDVKLNDSVGRGIVYNNGLHEFQTASIVEEGQNINEVINKLLEGMKGEKYPEAVKIPSLPDVISYDVIKNSISSYDKIPIGLTRHSLRPVMYNFFANISTVISSNKIENISVFIRSLIDIYSNNFNTIIVFFDFLNLVPEIKGKKNVYYYNTDFDSIFEKMLDFEKNPDVSKHHLLYFFYGISKVKSNATTVSGLDKLLKEIKINENHRTVFVDGAKKIKSIELDTWYTPFKNNSEGIWIGKGFDIQQVFRIPKVTKEMSANYSNSFGYTLIDGETMLTKYIEFYSLNSDDSGGDEDEE